MKQEPKQRLEKYSERFDNDESAIGNSETWGKRIKQETAYVKTKLLIEDTILEEASEKYAKNKSSSPVFQRAHKIDFTSGAKWQKEQDKKLYSEEDMNQYSDYVLMCSAEKTLKIPLPPNEWFEQFKKK